MPEKGLLLQVFLVWTFVGLAEWRQSRQTLQVGRLRRSRTGERGIRMVW